jgi:hypothetical protein
MGGHALKKVITVRKNKIEYNEIKDKVSNLLKSRGIIIDFIPELADKESFGDLDVLWSSSHNQDIIMKDVVIELFSPKEIVINGDVISFDLVDFQIDMIKCKTIEFAKFYFSYGDFGGLMGKITKKYNMTFGHNGFFLETNHHSLLLTKDVNKFCKFISIDFEHWLSIKIKEDLFELIKTSRLYKPEFFSSGNHQHRKRIKNRPLYIEFLKYIGVNEVEENDDSTDEDENKDKVLQEALDYFHKYEELESINKAIEKAKVIHDKFNGNMLKEMGYNGIQIGAIIKKFKSEHSDFDEWIYSSTNETIMDSLNKIILLNLI